MSTRDVGLVATSSSLSRLAENVAAVLMSVSFSTISKRKTEPVG
jgi:hypothetical protein